MRRTRHRLATACLLLGIAGTQSGCIIELLTGSTLIDGFGGFAAAFNAGARMKQCYTGIDGFRSFSSCSYHVGEAQETSSNEMTSEDGLFSDGLFGAIIDPLILQVPAGLGTFTGTYDDGSGPRALDIRPGLASIPIRPGLALAAESGQQLVIVQLPAAARSGVPAFLATAKAYQFTLGFREGGRPAGPLAVKALLSIRLDLRGNEFYIPTLPCVRDMADVPTLTIPAAATAQDLLGLATTALAGAATRGCSFVSFDYTGVTPAVTTTTLPGGGGNGDEICDNCRDDDGDGLVDVEDADCCGGSPTVATVRRVRLKPQGATSRVSLAATAGDPGLTTPLAAADLVVQLRGDATAATFCARVPADRVRAKKGLRFADPKGQVSTAGGLSRIGIRPPKKGTIALAARATRATLTPPAPGTLNVAWAVGGRCFAGSAPLRAKRGVLRSP